MQLCYCEEFNVLGIILRLNRVDPLLFDYRVELFRLVVLTLEDDIGLDLHHLLVVVFVVVGDRKWILVPVPAVVVCHLDLTQTLTGDLSRECQGQSERRPLRARSNLPRQLIRQHRRLHPKSLRGLLDVDRPRPHRLQDLPRVRVRPAGWLPTLATSSFCNLRKITKDLSSSAAGLLHSTRASSSRKSPYKWRNRLLWMKCEGYTCKAEPACVTHLLA